MASTSCPLCTSSQAISELEFHTSPVASCVVEVAALAVLPGSDDSFVDRDAAPRDPVPGTHREAVQVDSVAVGHHRFLDRCSGVRLASSSPTPTRYAVRITGSSGSNATAPGMSARDWNTSAAM